MKIPAGRLLVPAILLAAFHAEAGEAPVIIVSMQDCCAGEAWPEAEKKAREEFSALGFDVLVAAGAAIEEKQRRVELKALAEERGAFCALRIVRSAEGEGGGADLWITDRVTGKTVLRHIFVEGGEGAEAASIAALRLVELLQASLVEIKIAGAPAGEVEPPPQARKIVEEAIEEKVEEAVEEKKEPPVGIRLGIEAAGSPGGAGPIGAVGLAGRWTVVHVLSLELESAVSVIGKEIEEEEGRATFGAALVRAWVAWEIIRGGRFRPSIGVGGGALLAWSKGFASGAYETRSEFAHTGYLGGSLQAALVMTRNLWVRAGFVAGAAIPRIKVLFAGRKVAEFGLPLLEGFIALEVKIP